jgi:hypothetical protein
MRNTGRKNSKSMVATAKELGKKKVIDSLANDAAEDTPSEQIKIVPIGKDGLELIIAGPTIRTVEEALKRAEIDLAIWDVVTQEVNSWECVGKIKQGQDASGRWRREKLWKQPLWQVKIKLQRKAPKPIQEAIKGLVEEFSKKPPALPKVKYSKSTKPYMLELSLFDVHLGKRCWGAEAGAGDYDLKIAELDYLAAVDDLLEKIQHYKIGKILMPLGSDFFQQNSWIAETARGTPVDSVDDRFQRVFQVGCRALEHAIKRCREVAPVHTLHIAGNHDPATSWYMCEWLNARFNGDKHVSFDNGPLFRKYQRWGISLLGFTHEALKNLPLIMAREQQEAWAEAKHFEWHVGHLHKKMETVYVAGDTYNGVRVAVLPSLSGTDRWHHEQGFVGGLRTAEAYLWGTDEGYVGHFSTIARTERARLGLKAA